MILHYGPLPNQTATVLQDLLSRVGSPTPQSLSPYDGMRYMYKEQHLEEFSEEILMSMLRNQPDYDPTKQKPVAGPYVSADEKPANAPILTRLEDIDSSWVANYLRSALIGIKTRNKDGMKEYRYQNGEVAPMKSLDGDQCTARSEMLIQHHSFKPTDVTEAKAKLPYLLKRLQDKSIQMGVSALSLIIAYERAKRRRVDIRPRFILAEGVYAVDSTGHLSPNCMPDTANSGKKFPPALSWIEGHDPDSYYADALELLTVCEALGIDLCDEDPTEFTPEYIQKLKVTYISKNRNYLRGQTAVNGDVLNALSALKVSSGAFSATREYTRTDLINDKIQTILEYNRDKRSRTPDTITEDPLNPDKINRFLQAYTQSRGQKLLTADDFITRDGFLYLKSSPNEVYQILVKDYLLVPKPRSNVNTITAIIHASGTAYYICPEDHFVFISLDTLRDYIIYGAESNKQFGVWEVCSA